jgi:hypothetical protein
LIVQGRARYQQLVEEHREAVAGLDATAAQKLESPARNVSRVPPAPAPAPKPTEPLLGLLDPQRSARTAQIEALNELVREGKIDWAEWQHRVRAMELLAQTRAAAAEARAREAHEAANEHEPNAMER